MPVVNNVYSLILTLALIAAAIILFAMGQPAYAGICLAAVLGAQAIPHPIQKAADLKPKPPPEAP